MGTRKEIELKNFFVFNSSYGPKEGEELKKIIYYYPITDNSDVQIKNVGLVEGIIQFTENFKPNAPVSSLHTTKTRQLYFQPEKDFWIVMTLNLPLLTKDKDGQNTNEYLEDDLQDNVYNAVLKQTYHMYRLFNNTFESCNNNVGMLKGNLEVFLNKYITSLKLANADVLNICSGIQYLPLDKHTFLKVQSFVNLLESTYDEIIHTAFLFNDYLIWSGVEPQDMQIIYQHLITTLLRINMETELQGGSIPRNSPSPFAARHGRFLQGPTNLKVVRNIGKIPKLFLFSNANVEDYHFIVYGALGATVCLFIKGDVELTLDLFKRLDEYMNPKLSTLVGDIADYCTRQTLTPSSTPDTAPRFIYFNKLNLAYKSTVHLDNKQNGNLTCSEESVRLMADISSTNSLLGKAGETIVKTMNDSWVVCRTSNCREFYIALQQKNASLIDISDEVKKICDAELKGIFFHPL